MVLALQYKSEGEWTPCFDVPGVKIPSVSYLGFSAETGELSDNHDIISVETRNLYTVGNQQTKSGIGRDNAPKAKHKSSAKGGSWAWFWLKVVLFFVVCGGGYVGFTIYRTQKRSSRF